MLWYYRIGPKLKFKGDSAKLWQNFVCSDNSGQNIWSKVKKSSKIC